MKHLCSIAAVSLALSPAAASAGGDVGPVVINQDDEPVAAAPVIPGGVGGAPVPGAAAVPILPIALTAVAVGAAIILIGGGGGGSTNSTN